MNKISVVVAEDHEFFRRGLVEAIRSINCFDVIGEVSNGLELLNFMKKSTPDIVITDIKMPVLNGVEAVTHIVKIYPQIKILVLSLHGDEEYLEKFIELGVKGFLLKNSDSSTLEKALKSIAKDKQYFSEEFIPYFTKKYISCNRIQEKLLLTRREYEVLQLIADGYTNNEIGEKLQISSKTVMNHRTKILDKTNSKNTARLLNYAYKHRLVEL